MGAENRVAIAKDLVLDFSGLFASEKWRILPPKAP